tara:strand:- start:540 stop:812 length:273 start_codon:yes stop_codon:yes gene_type:complete
MKRKFSSIDVVLVISIMLFGLIVLGQYSTGKSMEKDHGHIDGPPHNYWIPTEEDIAYQDSMWIIIKQTQYEVDTIKESIDQIIIRLEDLD